MDPERWRRIDDLVEAALARDPAERAAFLDEVCDDDDLRREVESLVEGASRAERMLGSAAWRLPVLAPGTRLGPHEVLALVGSGGMGQVYKARDTRLDRIVALKILPPELSRDADRRARFAREARTISQLNHPHICTLHDIGEEDLPSTERGPSTAKVSYLVMEYLEGETLAARLGKGLLPLARALELGAQIADALAAAHKHGVVHRDLKPGNVMLARSGSSSSATVKLLDFGLAKLRAPGEQLVVDSGSALPTESEPLTGRGAILGTLPYMAPEQVEGKPADARTDLWALGTILYEMLTGQRAFEADSSASLIGAILEREPQPLAARRPLMPPALDRLVRKCLAKDPDERWDSAHDVADELQWIGQTSGAVAAAAPAGRRVTWTRAVSLASVALGTIGAGAGVTWILARPASAPPAAVQRFLLDTRPADGLLGQLTDERRLGINRPSRTAIALSPDGQWLVFSGVKGEQLQLYRRHLAEDGAVPIDGTEGGESPFFSPDGTWVGFFARGGLWRVRLGGGPPTELCPCAQVTGASWGSGHLIAFADSEGSGQGFRVIKVVPATGGVPKPVFAVDTAGKGRHHVLPHFLPDGETLLFTSVKDFRDPASASIDAVSLTSGVRTTIMAGAMDARYLPTGHLVYFRQGRLEAVPFDPVRVVVTGEAVGLVPDVMQSLNTGNWATETGAAQATVAATGTLVYVAGGIVPDKRREIVWVNRRGDLVETVLPPEGPNGQPRLSPDGRRMLYVRNDVNGSSLWYYDLDRRIPTMIPVTVARPWFPIWLPDGQRAMFATSQNGPFRLHVAPVDGSARSTPVGGEVSATVSELPGSWTPDGKTLVFVRMEKGTAALWRLQLDDGRVERSSLLEPPTPGGVVSWPAVSPNGRWLAYTSNESGRNEVYVQRFPDLGDRLRVSAAGGWAPVWRHDGRELFYLAGDPFSKARMMTVDVQTAADFDYSAARVLFDVPANVATAQTAVPNYNVSLDGQRFLFVRVVEESLPPPSQMHVVVNWFQELEAKVRGGR